MEELICEMSATYEKYIVAFVAVLYILVNGAFLVTIFL